MTTCKRVALYIISVLTLATFILVIEAAQKEELWIAGIPVKVKFERHSFATWFVELLLPRQYYSKDNLERIWQYYCEKYPDEKDKLDLRVYTDSPNSGSSTPQGRFDAIFSRQGEGAAAGGGDNEFYTYRPNLEKPDETQNVQLKGRYPFLRDAYMGDSTFDFVVAAGKGDVAKLERFFKEGTDVNGRDDKGRTALMAACSGGRIEVVRLLLARGADVNARDKEGDTALRNAVMAVVEDLHERDGWRWGHPAIVKFLLDNGADVNAQKEGWTPLLCAVSHGNNDIVRMLLNRGADINAKTYTGMSALARAIYDARPATFKILLEAGADINARDNDGYTPLMRAVSGDAEIVRLLLEKGADITAANIHGKKALEIAKKYHKNDAVIQMLLKAGAR